MFEQIRRHFIECRDSFAALAADKCLQQAIAQAAGRIATAFADGHRLYIIGNGGSAADAQHFAAELVGWYRRGDAPLSALALTTDTSFLTAWSNDNSFASVFTRQLQAHRAESADILFAITTSGRSANVLDALRWADQMGLVTIGLLGESGSLAERYCGVALTVPANQTPHIQELHIAIIHAICALIKT